MRKLKKNEYPVNIECLAANCLACNKRPNGVKYQDCKCFSWKQANMSKYKIEVVNDKISKCWEL